MFIAHNRMGRQMQSCYCTGDSSSHKKYRIPQPLGTRLFRLEIQKLDIKKYSIQKMSLDVITSCTVPHDNLEVKCDANQNVAPVNVSLDTNQNGMDINDSDSEDIPIKVSSAKEREARKIARLKQLEKMRAYEAACSRQNRYEKRTNSIRPVKLSLKKVKWKKDLYVYHFYHKES